MPKKPTKRKLNVRNVRHSDAPASVGLVLSVRDELRAEIGASRHELKGETSSLRGETSALRGEIASLRHELKGEASSLRGEIASLRHELKGETSALRGETSALRGEITSLRHETKSDFRKVQASVHRVEVLMEEQRADNRIVLDGLKNLIDRQDGFERDLNEIRKRQLVQG